MCLAVGIGLLHVLDVPDIWAVEVLLMNIM